MKKRVKKASARPMLPRQRADYSAIVDRPPLKLPSGARLVFWTIVNLEVWDIGKPMARQVLSPPTGVTQLPDVPIGAGTNTACGSGCGVSSICSSGRTSRATRWRSTRGSRGLRPRRATGQDRRLGVHGPFLPTGPIHDEPDQEGDDRALADVIERFCGKRRVGRLGPGLTQTRQRRTCWPCWNQYIADWVYDDEPTTIRDPRNGRR